MTTNPPSGPLPVGLFVPFLFLRALIFFSLELYDFSYASYEDLNRLAQFRVLQSWRHYIIYKILQETCSK